MKFIKTFILILFSLAAFSQDTTITTIRKIQKGVVYQFKIDSVQRMVITSDGGTTIQTVDSIFKTEQYQVIGKPPVDGDNNDTIDGMLEFVDWQDPEFEPYTAGFHIGSSVWPYDILANSLNGIYVSRLGGGGVVHIEDKGVTIERDGYNPTGGNEVLVRSEIEAITNAIPTQAENDDRYVNENIPDTISANKTFLPGNQINFGTSATSNVVAKNTGLYLTGPDSYANITPGYWEFYNNSAGILYFTPVSIEVERDGHIPTLNEFITLGETREVCSDSVATIETTGYLTGGGRTGIITIGADTTGTVGFATKYDLTTISGGGGSPGGSDNQVQYKSGSTFAGASNVEIASGNLKIDSTSTPSAPTSGTVFYTGENIGIEDPYFIGADGFNPSAIQGAFRDKNITMLTGSGIGGVINVYGCALPTGTYSTTLTGATTAGTNSYTKQQKTELLKTAAAGTNVSYLYLNAANWRRGSNAGEDGFKFQFTFGVATGTSNTSARLFAGWTSSISVPTDANPSTITNMFGFGYDSADTNLQWMHNDGSGTATKIDLGSSFPKPSVDRQESYEIEINCRPNGSAIWYKIRRIHTGATASGSVTTDIPANTTYLAPRVYLSNAGVSAVNGLGFMKMYIETSEF